MVGMQLKKMKLLILIALLFLTNLDINSAQERTIFPKSKNHLFLELFGNGILYSVNYERLLSDNFSSRIGYSYMPDLIYSTIPITASYIIGRGSSKAEAGMGITITTSVFDGVFGTRKEKQTYLLLTGVFGIKYYKPRGGYTVKITFTPFYSPHLKPSKFQLYGGISIGYGF